MEAATPGEGQRDGGRSWTEGSRAGASGEESAAVTCSWAPRGPRFGANAQVKGQVGNVAAPFWSTAAGKPFHHRKCSLSGGTSRSEE